MNAAEFESRSLWDNCIMGVVAQVVRSWLDSQPRWSTCPNILEHNTEPRTAPPGAARCPPNTAVQSLFEFTEWHSETFLCPCETKMFVLDRSLHPAATRSVTLSSQSSRSPLQCPSWMETQLERLRELVECHRWFSTSTFNRFWTDHSWLHAQTVSCGSETLWREKTWTCVWLNEFYLFKRNSLVSTKYI